MVAPHTLCLAGHNIHVIRNGVKLLFQVSDILNVCKHSNDASHFYTQHHINGCTSWKKGPRGYWFCDINDLCDIASRIDEGKTWLAQMLDVYVNDVRNRCVYMLYIVNNILVPPIVPNGHHNPCQY